MSLWDEPQWANDDGDVRHTGKSQYDSTVNGDLKWSVDAANITGNMAIDSEGNIVESVSSEIKRQVISAETSATMRTLLEYVVENGAKNGKVAGYRVGGKTGTDADVITVSKNGIPTALLSIPLRYMHTPVETVDTGDIVAVGELMAAMLAEGVF